MTAILLLAAAALFASCEAISSFIHDDEVVARVGKEKLYRSRLKQYIPDNVTPEDSANLAMQYISAWASEILFMKVAEDHLSKAEKDVAQELEDYRHSLLKFRYEQSYVNERLDTLITEEQIEAFFKDHEDLFKLERPVLKVRFLDIMEDSPNKEMILRKMSSTDYSDVAVADSLAKISALRYFDKSEEWVDAALLAREFGTDYVGMLSALKDSFIKISQDGRLRAAYVLDIRKSGTAPLEYTRMRIRDIILSNRKHDLLTGLEQDLLKDALGKKQFVVY